MFSDCIAELDESSFTLKLDFFVQDSNYGYYIVSKPMFDALTSVSKWDMQLDFPVLGDPSSVPPFPFTLSGSVVDA